MVIDGAVIIMLGDGSRFSREPRMTEVAEPGSNCGFNTSEGVEGGGYRWYQFLAIWSQQNAIFGDAIVRDIVALWKVRSY